MPLPNWLPPLISVSPWTTQTFDDLYRTFCRDFKGPRITLDGHSVWYNKANIEDKRESLFWHLTSRKDKTTLARMPDPARCAKLAWFAAIIANANQPEVTRWDYKESDGGINTYLWLQEHDCLVLLKKMNDGSYRLTTGYHVDPGTRRSLEKKYSKREQ